MTMRLIKYFKYAIFISDVSKRIMFAFQTVITQVFRNFFQPIGKLFTWLKFNEEVILTFYISWKHTHTHTFGLA